MSKIKVSIIIPAYNGEKYIERCIKSVTSQTLREIEIIVVNDGSIDNTQGIIEILAKQDSRIVLVNKDNGGLSSARNTGLDMAIGEYVQHLDGDDWIEKTASEDLYKYAKEKNLDIVVSDFFRDDDNGNVIYKFDTKLEGVFGSDSFLEVFFLAHHDSSAVWNKLFRRSLYSHIRSPIWASFGEDFLAVGRLALKAKKMGKINKAYTHYISNPNSITQFETAKKLCSFFKVYDELERCFVEYGEYERYKYKILKGRYTIFASFVTQKPFYGDLGYQEGLRYLLSYFKSYDIKLVQILRAFPSKDVYFVFCILYFLKLFPFKYTFYILNSIFFPLRKILH